MGNSWNEEELKRYLKHLKSLSKYNPTSQKLKDALFCLKEMINIYYEVKIDGDDLFDEDMQTWFEEGLNFEIDESMLVKIIRENIETFMEAEDMICTMNFTKGDIKRIDSIFNAKDLKVIDGNSALTKEEIVDINLKYLDSFKSKKQLNLFQKFLKYNPNFLHVSSDNQMGVLGICFPITNKKMFLWINDYNNLVTLNTACHEIQHILAFYKYGFEDYNKDFDEIFSSVHELYFTDFLLEEGYDETEILDLKKANMMVAFDIINAFAKCYFQYDEVIDKKYRLKSNAKSLVLKHFEKGKEELGLFGNDIENANYFLNLLIAYYIYYNFDKDESVKEIDKLIRSDDTNDFIYPRAKEIIVLMQKDLERINRRQKELNDQSKMARKIDGIKK